MTERKWTPGPWVTNGGDVFSVDGEGNHEWDIAALIDFCGPHYNSTEANTHLIAAAPDLYKALADFVYDFDGRTATLDAARAALAKARGE